MKRLKMVLLAGLVVAAGIVGIAYSGLYNVAATEPHSGIVHWFFTTTSNASIKQRAKAIDVPELTDDSLVKAGVNDFSAMCVGCHGAPGVAPEAMGQGLSPPAPDLTESAARMTPAELFWVTKNGIKMTGMPAWGATHNDDALWPVVALILKLPELDADGYQALVASAQGMGHHAPGHSGTEQSDADTIPADKEVARDDGHEHEH